MLLPVLVFVMTIALIMGAYTAIGYAVGQNARRRLELRLREVGPSSDTPESSVLMRPAQGPLPRIDRALARSGTGSHLARLIGQSGVNTTPSAMVVASIGVAVVAALCASLVVRQPYAPAIAGLAGTVAPFLWLLQRRFSRLKKFEEQFPDALDLMSRAIRAGHAFQTALGMVADELRAPVGPEFKKTFDQQNFGLPLQDALNELALRASSLDVRFFVTAVAIQRETGGNLAEILDNLARVVRERFKIRRQVRVHTAHGRFTGYVLIALPAALGIALSLINPDHMNLLFRERMGQMMLSAAVVMQVVGFVWIRQVVKIEV